MPDAEGYYEPRPARAVKIAFRLTVGFFALFGLYAWGDHHWIGHHDLHPQWWQWLLLAGWAIFIWSEWARREPPDLLGRLFRRMVWGHPKHGYND